MDSRLLATIIIFPIWLVLVIVFRRHRQWLLYYMVGAFGLTLMLVFLAELTGFDQIVVNTASFHVHFIAERYFHLSNQLLTNGRFQIFLASGGSSILKLGIECSAVLESSILIGLIAFYPLFDVDQKILRITFGLLMTYVLNIARLLIIVLMAYKYGPDYIFVAHAFVARAFFFFFELMLYWWLMTKPSVKTVGDSLNLKIPLSRAAKIGVSLKRSNSIIQIIFIAFVLTFSMYTFLVSPETPKILSGLKVTNRPIIYQEETGIVESSQAILGAKDQPITFEPLVDALLKKKTEVVHYVSVPNSRIKEFYNIVVTEATQPMTLELYINGKFVNRTTVTAEGVKEQNTLFENPFSLSGGDFVGLRFINSSNKTGSYQIKILENNE